VYALDLGEHADQLLVARDLEGRGDEGGLVLFIGGHGGIADVEAEVGEHLDDVAQQADAVAALDLDRDGVAAAVLVAPRDLEQALGLGAADDIGAVAAVDGDAAAAGDVADHGVAGDRGAAAGRVAEDPALAVDADAAGRAALARRALGADLGHGGRVCGG